MKTDKQLCLIFEANPQWLFELTGLPSPGPCQFQSVSLKAIEQTADGVLIPDAINEVITVLEIQFQRDETIYLRLIQEMVLIQQKIRGRTVQGVILFADHALDPRTEPWCHVVSTHSLVETFERLAAQQPLHPLVAVFEPLIEEDAEKLEQRAARCYNQIVSSELGEPQKSVLLEVFVNWLEQRFVNKGKAEIETMLVGQLPDLRETQSGRDLIAIGIQEGIEKGKRQSLVQLLESRFGKLDSPWIEKIEAIKGVELLDRYFQRALSMRSLDHLFIED